MKKDLEYLASVPLFEGLPKSDLKAILAEMQEEPYAAGSTIVAEGQKGGRFYLITRGRAKLVRDGRARRTMGPGEAFGEMSLLDGEPRSATVRADTDMTTLSLASWNFLALLEGNWKMTRKIMAILTARIRALEKVD